MAIKATIYKAKVQFSDLDRNIYTDHNLTLARHPSETDERMMVRLLAFVLNAPVNNDRGTLEFGRDMWEPDEPALWHKNFSDEILHWVEVGQPDDKRLMKASGRARQAQAPVSSSAWRTAAWSAALSAPSQPWCGTRPSMAVPASVSVTADIPAGRTTARVHYTTPTATDAGGALQVKMDERQFRFLVLPGARDAYLASGWEVFGPGEFEAGLAALKASGTAYELGDTGLCAQRRVQQIAVFKDPSGNRHELVWGFQSDFVQFASPTGIRRFVTGNIGMGHTVLPAPNFEATAKFMREVMGFGLSDLFNFKPAGDAGPTLPIHFFHCNNGRHPRPGAIRTSNEEWGWKSPGCWLKCPCIRSG